MFAPVIADEPDVTILEPAGTVFVPGFPHTLGVEFVVEHDPVKDLNVLDVKVNDVSLLGGTIGNPYQVPGNENGCSANVLASPFTDCEIIGTDQAYSSLDWTISGPGTYLLEVSIKHGGSTGSGEETVFVQLVTVEYPAPPAEANAYINDTYKAQLRPRQRGCIISQIAYNHAHHESYGPKGGPYDIPLIEADVDQYFGQC